MTPASAKSQHGIAVLPAVACALAGAAVFQFFGNANRGYIDSASLFYWWGFQWTNAASETEHGWLILALAAGVFWWNLRETRAKGAPGVDPGRGAGGAWRAGELAGPVAMFAGLALHALGFVAQQARLSIVGLLVFSWGGLRLAGGWRWGAAAVFPLGFLVFAIPLNAVEVSFPLRVWVVDTSAAIARALGIGVLQNGTQLIAPDGRYHYDVAAECSGVRSLTAMVALSLLAGYLSFASRWRRTLIVALCLPLVYLGNVARILAIVLAAQAGGRKWGDLAHDAMGVGVFVIVLGGVLAAVMLLQRRWPETERPARANTNAAGAAAASEHDYDHEQEHDRRGPTPRGRGLYWCAGGVAACALGEMVLLHRIAHTPPDGAVGVALAADGLNPVELPAFIGTDWAGRRAEVSPVERELLPPDTGYSRKLYVSLGMPAPAVFLSVVLSGRDRTSIHRPELCLVGQGWTITGARTHRFNAPGRDAFPAQVLQVQRERVTPRGRERVPELVAYWFVAGDTVVASHWQRLALDAWNRLAHRRVDRWAYVLLQTDALDGEAAALARMQAILDGTLPAMRPARTAAGSPAP